MNTNTRVVPLLVAMLSTACGGSGDGGTQDGTRGPTGTTADISLLFMGNSHSSVNDLDGMVAAMVRIGRPGKSVGEVVAPGYMFLEERLNDSASVNLLASQNWSFVILQAQKYSTSGQFTYSTAEAEEFIRRARQQHAVPISASCFRWQPLSARGRIPRSTGPVRDDHRLVAARSAGAE